MVSFPGGYDPLCLGRGSDAHFFYSCEEKKKDALDEWDPQTGHLGLHPAKFLSVAMRDYG